ncbi:hypothetical protein HMN09_01309700 [Mycena chlorophos]|uniref:Uncharacterized protein n=1 Tax=Mycena chlorophos TaxID=658473 RepID=A0A8H6S064_MYCCL|nr:hypothetical protein HMN09_01309700 [Mycena chlorophos]
MVGSLLKLLASSALLLSANASPDMRAHLRHARATASSPTLTNGTAGILSGTVGSMVWGSSGILTSACPAGSLITNCYSMFLSPNASAMLDTAHLDSPRQRTEWHFPTLSTGSSFSYSWKQYLATGTSTSVHFFHLMQVFGVPENGPVLTLDALSGQLTIVDTSCGSSCPTTPLSNYWGQYTTHYISGKTGASGTLTYTVKGQTGSTILSYTRPTGSLGSGDVYIKFGTYRLTVAGMSAANSTCGDWATY